MPDSSCAILVVDDSEDFRSLLSHYLRGFSCRVRYARDGEEAVEMFHAGRFDLIIMDIIMPLMDGVDAIRAIRKIEKGRGPGHVPILALSGEDAVEVGVDSMGAGATRMLLKPVSRSGLIETVCELMDIPLPEDLASG